MYYLTCSSRLVRLNNQQHPACYCNLHHLFTFNPSYSKVSHKVLINILLQLVIKHSSSKPTLTHHFTHQHCSSYQWLV